MKKLRLSRYTKKRLTIVGLALGAGLALHSCGDAEAEPTADPAEVQRFLAEMEATQRSMASEGEPDRSERQIHKLVEDAAERGPTVPTINRIETVVASRLG